jgi:hypothetical protein
MAFQGCSLCGESHRAAYPRSGERTWTALPLSSIACIGAPVLMLNQPLSTVGADGVGVTPVGAVSHVKIRTPLRRVATLLGRPSVGDRRHPRS